MSQTKKKNKKGYYDPCLEKMVSGKDIPCYEKKGALCRKQEDFCCSNCRYWPIKGGD